MNNFYLELYAFHLRHSLTEPPDRATDNADRLWENLAKLGEATLPFSGLTNLRSKLVCYQNGQYDPKLELGRQTDWLTNSGKIDVGSIPTAEGFKIKATLQPFLLNDTYAADLSLSPETNIPIEVPKLQHFQPKSLLPDSIQASLGQTLWIYGEVDKTDAECKAIAEQYAIALLAGTSFNPALVNQGQLLGSFLFEYQATDPKNPQDLAKQCHILISLNNTRANTLDLAGKAYDWLRDLLCCWHKIRYIYQQARDRYPKARELYSKLEQEMQNLTSSLSDRKTRLDTLNDLLEKLPQDYLDYARCLRDLKAHYTSIDTNIKNYQNCLNKIKISGDIPDFWQEFLRTSIIQWKQQIQIDIDYLTPGKELYEQLINTVRGIAEVDQAQSDRALQNTVQAVGFGIGAAGVVATSAPYWIKQEPDTIPPDKTVFSKSLGTFILIIFLSFAAGSLMWGICTAFTADSRLMKYKVFLDSRIRGNDRLNLCTSHTWKMLYESQKHYQSSKAQIFSQKQSAKPG